MSDAYVLRTLGARDLDRAAGLHEAAFAALGERAWTRQDVAELLAAPGVAGLLIEDEDGDVGFALWRRAVDESELLTLAVSPARQRRGAGRTLLAAVIDRARIAGARTLFLEVGIDNSPARALYEAAGFASVATRPAYYQRRNGPPADALVMQLSLI
jgi:[ribosomal protein S18]-alanine N-acetyltransferase